MSAPQAAKNAPPSIMPSRPTLTTPERSDTTPPSAPKTSGVAKRSIAATSADHTKTCSRLPVPDCVKTTARAPPAMPMTMAAQPWRFSPARTAQAPQSSAASASRSESTGVRMVIGGTVM
jgi:hypothetical protein